MVRAARRASPSPQRSRHKSNRGLCSICSRSDAGTEPCRELCFRALPITDALGDGGEPVAHLQRIAGIAARVEAQKRVGGDVGGAFVAFNKCLRLRDADREERGEDDQIILPTKHIRHASSVDGGFQPSLIAQRHRRGTRALHDFRMERDDLHNTEMTDLGHLLLREGAVARLILLPRLFENLPQFR